MKNDTKTHGVKLEYFFYVSNNKINPLEHSNKEFIHYDIPSFDKYKGPKIEIGQDIKSIKNIVYPNSILVSKINPKFLRILTVKQCKDNCISSTEFLVLRFKKKENEELIDFFNALLNSSKFNNYLIAYANGTSCSHQRVKSKDILNYSFSSFSKTQMLFIGKMYCLIETKISILKMINSILEEIGSLIYNNLFSNIPILENKIILTQSLENISNDSNLLEEKNWKIGLFGNYVKTVRGCSYRSKDLMDSYNALVTLKCIESGGGFKNNGLKEYKGDYKKDQVVTKGEIVVAHTDLTQKREVLGKPAIVREINKYKNLIASLDLVIVRPKDNSISPSFIYYTLKSNNFQNQAYRYTNGTTVLHLNIKAITDFIIAIPPENIMIKFNSITNLLFAKIEINYNEIQLLEELKDTLIPKLMSGEIRVPLESNQ